MSRLRLTAYGRDSQLVFRDICYSDAPLFIYMIFVHYLNNNGFLSSSVCLLSTVLRLEAFYLPSIYLTLRTVFFKNATLFLDSFA
jgi:hypothetical protein